MRDYVEGLASSQRSGEERRVVWVGDSGQAGTDVYWCANVGQWLAVDLQDLDAAVKSAEHIALVQLSCEADPEAIESVSLACDCEREDGLWLVDSNSLGSLTRRYGPALHVIWESSGPASAAWRQDRAHRPRLQPRMPGSRVMD